MGARVVRGAGRPSSTPGRGGLGLCRPDPRVLQPVKRRVGVGGTLRPRSLRAPSRPCARRAFAPPPGLGGREPRRGARSPVPAPGGREDPAVGPCSLTSGELGRWRGGGPSLALPFCEGLRGSSCESEAPVSDRSKTFPTDPSRQEPDLTKRAPRRRGERAAGGNRSVQAAVSSGGAGGETFISRPRPQPPALARCYFAFKENV